MIMNPSNSMLHTHGHVCASERKSGSMELLKTLYTHPPRLVCFFVGLHKNEIASRLFLVEKCTHQTHLNSNHRKLDEFLATFPQKFSCTNVFEKEREKEIGYNAFTFQSMHVAST